MLRRETREARRWTLAAALTVATTLVCGCHTAVGNYFHNRARDFGECWRAEAGLGVGAGLGGRALGLVSTGFVFGNWRRSLTVGVAYGELSPGAATAAMPWISEMSIPPVSILFRHNSQKLFDFDEEHLDYRSAALAILPGLLSWRGYTNDAGKAVDAWIWSPHPVLQSDMLPPPKWWRDARLHAFDVEVHAFIGFFGVRVGFSPGEFLDFLLGWFGVDIVGDDRPLPGRP